MAIILTALRWLARGSGLALAGGFLLLVAGEVLSPHSGPPTHFTEWLGIALLATACLAPLVAWKWEFEGAALSLAALAAFTTVVSFRGAQGMKVAAVLSIPALLLLADWAMRRLLEEPHEEV